MSNYPASKDTWDDVENGVDDWNDFMFRKAGQGLAVVVEALQDFAGYASDTAATSAGVGSLNERVIRLEELGGIRMFIQASPPSTPLSGDLWVHTGVTPWVIGYYDGSSWNMLGASAAMLGNIPVSIDEGVAGYVVAYDGDTNTLKLMEPGQFNTITAVGQLAVGGPGGTVIGLNMGEFGQFLGPKEDGTGLEWRWPVFRAFQQAGLSTPLMPSVSPQGVGGSTTYTYRIIAVDARGYRSLAGPLRNTTVGNATLSSSNFNRVTWFKVPGAVQYWVVRDDTDAFLVNYTPGASSETYDDDGGSGTAYSAPVRNETLDLGITGYFRANGGVIQVDDGLTVEPPVSAVGGSRVYYNKTLEKWRVSTNGDAYTDFGEAGTGLDGHTIQDATPTDMTQRNNLRFTGIATVTDDAVNDVTIVDIPAAAGGGSYDIIEENNTPQTQRSTLDLIEGTGIDVTALDDPGNDRTKITIAGKPMVGSGSSHAPGLVPDPPSSAGTTKFLREDGSWSDIPSGSGHTIQDEGVAQTARNNLNFVGRGVVASDDSANNATVVTIPSAIYMKNGGSGVTRPQVNLIEGAGVTLTVADNSGANRADVTISTAGGASAHVIQEETTPLSARAGLNFTGAGVAATDDSGNNRTDVTVPGYYHTVEVDDAAQTQRHKLNLVAGTGIALTPTDDSGGDTTDVEIAVTGGATGYDTIQDEGVDLPQQPILNFITPGQGLAVLTADDPTHNRTNVQIAGTIFIGSGASHAAGLVPDPGSSAGTTKFLREDGSWEVPPGTGGGGGSGVSLADAILLGGGS